MAVARPQVTTSAKQLITWCRKLAFCAGDVAKSDRVRDHQIGRADDAFLSANEGPGLARRQQRATGGSLRSKPRDQEREPSEHGRAVAAARAVRDRVLADGRRLTRPAGSELAMTSKEMPRYGAFGAVSECPAPP